MKNAKKIMEKQGYRFVGNHSAVKICEWTKKSLIDNNKGECFKNKFYGIPSWRCCQISPWILCPNQCIHCWRAIELKLKLNKKLIDSPVGIINKCIEAQRKLLIGFKGNEKTNENKFREAQEPMQFAISLTGEPTLYPGIGELIAELRKQKKTSFLVTNGLQKAVLSKLNKKKQLPTQLYISLNSPNKKMYDEWHKSSVKNAWRKFNETLKLFPRLGTRKAIRMTLVKELNDKEEYIKDFAKLIIKAKPNFIEVKSYMAIGFSRERLGYDLMLSHSEIKEYTKRLSKKLGKGYKILDEHKLSRVVLIGKDRKRMRIRKEEI